MTDKKKRTQQEYLDSCEKSKLINYNVYFQNVMYVADTFRVDASEIMEDEVYINRRSVNQQF